ncbi:MAG: GSCFA domain-containing protein [Mangrovibacterium sp.]
MNRYYTPVEIPRLHVTIDYQSRLMFMGSCFADSIGGKFEELKFSSEVNPFGVLFNPLSVAKALRHAMAAREFEEKDLFVQHGLYKSFDFHSQFAHAEASEALERMNDAVMRAHNQLKDADVLFITFGTAWVYELAESGEVVANCHKQIGDFFTRRRLKVAEIVSTWEKLLAELKAFNPTLQVIFTVSPIRHWKDGAHGNQLSKSTLLLAVDELQHVQGRSYFPSYELVMDELRDYRFYAADMLHLSELAVNHIWEKVQKSLINPSVWLFMQRVARLNQAVQHRIFNPKSEEAAKFVAANQKLIAELEAEFPKIDFKKEKIYFEHIQ